MDLLITSKLSIKLTKLDKLFVDEDLGAALKVVNSYINDRNIGGGRGIAWAQVEELIEFSCYISPNVEMNSLESFLEVVYRQ